MRMVYICIAYNKEIYFVKEFCSLNNPGHDKHFKCMIAQGVK